MAASAASTAYEFTAARPARVAEPYAEMFSPDTPLVWWYGRLRYADAPESYRLTRWRERLRAWWYDKAKQPRVSDESRPVFPDDRAARGSYAEARALCWTSNCYVRALPFGQTPFGDELFDNPTFIRPALEPLRAVEFAARYTKTLEDFVCPAVSAENRALKDAIQEMEGRLRMLAGDT